MPSRSPLCGPTRVLAAIATLMMLVVLQDRLADPRIEWVHLVVAVATAFAMQRVESFRIERLRQALGLAGFGILLAMPFLGDVVQRSVASMGNPVEVQAILALRNLMLGLAASTVNNRSLRFATLASCFTALYAILLLMNSWNIALMFAYTIVGMWWLTGAYWSRISNSFVSRRERSIPWKPLLGTSLLGMLILVLLFPLATGTSYTTAINGFLPSSGGTRWQDEFAFGGVGDGTQLVSAKDDASSFGPVESELFLESEMPSLYDCFNEFSEPPEKKIRKQARSIPLAPSQMKENHEKKGVNKKPGREFKSVRKRNDKKKPPKVGDLPSAELLQIAGRVPVHLGLYAYDLWDGHDLSSSNRAAPKKLYFERRSAEENWVRCRGLIEDDLMTHREQHEVRIINLKTDRLPSPPSLIGAHIDKIHTANLFNTTKDGMLALDMAFIPQLSVIHVESLYRRLIDRPAPVKTDTKVNPSDPVAILANEWTAGLPEGWSRIEAVCSRLRNGYELDPAAMVPDTVDDAANYFLTEAGRGPDYLFAASAATLLRSLGFETRVVSGFYARPENYDRQSRVTSVYANDAHFWIEVLATSVDENHPEYDPEEQHWVPVDPSPGYEVLYAPESIWSWLLARSVLTLEAVKRNPLKFATVLAVGIIAWMKRTFLCDLVITLWWRAQFEWGDTRDRVISTLRLIERRARIYGRPRCKAVPIGRWDILADLHHQKGRGFIEIADWALYGSDRRPLQSAGDIAALCWQVAEMPIPNSGASGNTGAAETEESK